MLLIIQIVNFFNRLIDIYYVLLIVYILSSWFPQIIGSKIGYYLGKITEPFLNIFRGIIPNAGVLDFSPLLAFLVLRLIQEGIVFLARLVIGY